ncbi:MAG: DUF4386 domain-containing protein [Caulobacteraceae bacterium]
MATIERGEAAARGARRDEIPARSAQRYARVAGVLILVSLLAGLFGEVYVPNATLGVDAGALGRHSALLRAGAAAYLLEALCDVSLTLIFFVLFRPVSRNMALLAAFFRLEATAVFGASEFFYLTAVLASGGPASLKTIPQDQLRALMHFSFEVYASGSSNMVFYGAGAIVIGWLIWRSGFLPKVLGALWVVGGLGMVANAFATVAAPPLARFWELVPLLAAMLALAVWFLARGINTARWEELRPEGGRI